MQKRTSKTQAHPGAKPVVTVEIIEHLSDNDLSDLCDVTEYTIQSGGGFGWVTPPTHQVLERYWYGVLAVPERHIIIARIDGVICGAVQLVEPSKHNQAQNFAAQILACFVAPWARGHNIGAQLIETSENLALEKDYSFLNMDIRETQKSAITLFEKLGFKRWGENPYYARVNEDFITGYYYTKQISQTLKPARPYIRLTQ